jgi:uncharacterized membrane protein
MICEIGQHRRTGPLCLRDKARELGIPENMIEMMTAGQGGVRAEGMRPGMAGDNIAFGMNPMQFQPNIYTLLVSGVVIISVIIMITFLREENI